MFCVAVYLFALYCVSLWIEGKKPFWMTENTVVIWNLGLAAFSLFGSIRLLPKLVKILNTGNGFDKSVSDLKCCNCTISLMILMAKLIFALLLLQNDPESSDVLLVLLVPAIQIGGAG